MSPQLGVRKRTLELVQKRLGRDSLEVACGERSQHIGAGAP
jgi:hypothetical protein